MKECTLVGLVNKSLTFLLSLIRQKKSLNERKWNAVALKCSVIKMDINKCNRLILQKLWLTHLKQNVTWMLGFQQINWQSMADLTTQGEIKFCYFNSTLNAFYWQNAAVWNSWIRARSPPFKITLIKHMLYLQKARPNIVNIGTDLTVCVFPVIMYFVAQRQLTVLIKKMTVLRAIQMNPGSNLMSVWLAEPLQTTSWPHANKHCQRSYHKLNCQMNWNKLIPSSCNLSVVVVMKNKLELINLHFHITLSQSTP